MKKKKDSNNQKLKKLKIQIKALSLKECIPSAISLRKREELHIVSSLLPKF
jgi:hypothetical protein